VTELALSRASRVSIEAVSVVLISESTSVDTSGDLKPSKDTHETEDCERNSVSDGKGIPTADLVCSYRSW
jgi:hypothetical protein